MEEITVLIWDVVAIVEEVVTGPHQLHTVTHDTLIWLPSMYCSDARVGAPICPGMGVALVMCSSCMLTNRPSKLYGGGSCHVLLTYVNKRDPVNHVVSKKSENKKFLCPTGMNLFV
jgi:hypothetical protein